MQGGSSIAKALEKHPKIFGMNPYKYGTLGTIVEGGYADIILINGNPLEDIKLIGRQYVDFVMKDGVTYKNTL